MIAQIFPKDFHRYLSLPVLGPLMDSYAAWLQGQRYTWRSTRFELRMAAHVCAYLKRRGVRSVAELRDEHLQSCYRLFRRKFPNEEGSVHVVATFLGEQGQVRKFCAPPSSPIQLHLSAFEAYLRDVRGFAPRTIHSQVQFAREFLAWLGIENEPQRLSSLDSRVIEDFVRRLAKRMGRVALQKPIATIRSLLRFLAARGIVAPGLDNLIDTPRVYRQEQLPRALPWATVQALLRSIDRATGIGARDYAMLSLMATYGLRACDVVALTLDDIQWRARCIRICQSKTGQPLELPLTDAVGSALCDYLRKVPRYGAFRQLFLRLKAPGGPLKSTAVTEAFQAWARKSGLDIAFQGAYCLRHSYAVHALRCGLSMKSIADLLGHRSPESTANYLRLSLDDLREVALPVPRLSRRYAEGRPS